MDDRVLDSLATAAENTGQYISETAGLNELVGPPNTNDGINPPSIPGVPGLGLRNPITMLGAVANVVRNRQDALDDAQPTLQDLAEISVRARSELQNRNASDGINQNGLISDDETPQPPPEWTYDWTSGTLQQTSNPHDPDYDPTGGSTGQPGDNPDGYGSPVGDPRTGDDADQGGNGPSTPGDTNGPDTPSSPDGTGGYDHSGSGTTTGTFTPPGVWEGGNGTQDHGTPDPSLPENPDYVGIQPLILDLDGDGVEVAFGQQTSFDWDGDGFWERGSWTSGDDGFLVLDFDADGTRGGGDDVIDQARELVWSLWGNDGDTDLQALGRAFDDNDDGVINDLDGVWSELRIWQDLNQDGVTDSSAVFGCRVYASV
mmetsp:Transcript_18363/g.29586  ORF Transcript_18363/g.29586 Transcript_18363/m.29586 type:complete len:373 (-) Transcript_18363:3204-4322(-)